MSDSREERFRNKQDLNLSIETSDSGPACNLPRPHGLQGEVFATVIFRFHILQQDHTARNLPVFDLASVVCNLPADCRRSCAIVFRYRSMCVRGQAGVLGWSVWKEQYHTFSSSISQEGAIPRVSATMPWLLCLFMVTPGATVPWVL